MKFKLTILILIIAIATFGSVNRAHAQSSGGGSGQTVPIGTDLDYNITMQHTKDYITDKFAYEAAGMVLQQLTNSVVKWINSGFKGNPSFVNDPVSFFNNSADQITGAFIANAGPLANLCSPFSIDIRLALALRFGLGGTSSRNQYTCTLSSILKAQNKNIQGFMNGDFSQGGWSAYLALTTEPQNNVYGAYIIAQGDLANKISNQVNAINDDLNRGRGFMSWQNCKDVSTQDTNDPGGELSTGSGSTAGSGSDYGDELNAGHPQKTTKQVCETETPGSVIAGQLDKSVGLTQDRLNMADSINKVAAALLSQLLQQVMSKGLFHTNTQTANGSLASLRQQLLNALNQYDSLTGTKTALKNENSALDLINGVADDYNKALQCFNTLASSSPASSSFAQSGISSVQNAIATKITPLLAQYQNQIDFINIQSSAVNDLRTRIKAATSLAQLQTLLSAVTDLTGTNSSTSIVNGSASDLAQAKDQAKTLKQDAAQFLSSCRNYSPNTGAHP